MKTNKITFFSNQSEAKPKQMVTLRTHAFPRMALVTCFPALGTVTRFPARGTGYMFPRARHRNMSSRARHRNMFSRARHLNMFFRAWHLFHYHDTFEPYFPVVLFIMLYKVVLTFESVDKILKCDHSNESY